MQIILKIFTMWKYFMITEVRSFNLMCMKTKLSMITGSKNLALVEGLCSLQLNVLLWFSLLETILRNLVLLEQIRFDKPWKHKIDKCINKSQLIFQESLSAIVHAIRNTGNLPAAGEDHDFYYSFSDFREFRTAQGARLLSKWEYWCVLF